MAGRSHPRARRSLPRATSPRRCAVQESTESHPKLSYPLRALLTGEARPADARGPGYDSSTAGAPCDTLAPMGQPRVRGWSSALSLFEEVA